MICNFDEIIDRGGNSFGRQLSGYMRLNVACPRGVPEQAMAQLKAAVDAL